MIGPYSPRRRDESPRWYRHEHSDGGLLELGTRGDGRQEGLTGVGIRKRPFLNDNDCVFEC